MSRLSTFNNLNSSLNDNFEGRPYVVTYTLGQRFNFPEANVLHDLCEFTIQRPTGAPDNYRIYTPESNLYGLSVISTSANDTLAGIGVRRVRVHYLDANWELMHIDVDLNGTTAVEFLEGQVRRVIDFFSIETGDTPVAFGDIILQTSSGSVIETPWTGQQNLGQISQGGNKDLTAIFTVPEGKEVIVADYNVSSANADQSIRLRSNVDSITRGLLPANSFVFQSINLIGSNSTSAELFEYLKFPSRADIKVSVSPTAVTADASCHVVLIMVDKVPPP